MTIHHFHKKKIISNENKLINKHKSEEPFLALHYNHTFCSAKKKGKKKKQQKKKKIDVKELKAVKWYL